MIVPKGADRRADGGGVRTSLHIPLADIDLLGRVADQLRSLQRRAIWADEGTQRTGPNDVGLQLLPIARLLLFQRSERALAFADCDFGEAVWDMMLELYVAHYEERQVGAYALARLIRIPPSTALRWIAVMEKQGQVIRLADEADLRRSLVTLAHGFRERLEVHFAGVRQAMLATDICQMSKT